MMSVAELQLELHKVIDSIEDENQLSAIYSAIKGEKGPYKAMSIEDYTKAIDLARQQISTGKYRSLDDLEEASKAW